MNHLQKLAKFAKRFQSRESYKNILFGGGNPLLDISAKLKTGEFVMSQGLKPNTSVLAGEEHAGLFDNMQKRYNLDYTAGGATQNVFRCFQWMLGEGDGCATYVGCVGDDEEADILRECMEKDGVNPLYLVNPYKETGKCACLIHKQYRTLVAALGASEEYDYRHFKLDKVQERMEEAELFYFSGYFLSACPEAILDICFHSFEHEKILGINLSAEFIINDYMWILLPTLFSSDYIFGNETEARCMARKLKFEETHELDAIASTLVSTLPYREGKPKTAIFTQGGSGDILVASQGEERGDVELLSFPIINVPQEEVVDTNGAGDSFVGGFLSQVAKGEELEKCVQAGMYASRVCVKTCGVVYPYTAPHFS